MVNALRRELLRIVIRLIQAHHQGDIFALKIRYIVFWPEVVVATGAALALGVWAGKSQKTAFHAPVQITVLWGKEN